MNTNTTTEADVIAFLQQQRVALCVPEWAFISATHTSNNTPSFSLFGHISIGGNFRWVNGDGPSLDEAAAAFAAKLPPTGEALVAAKRREAAKLLAEADAMAEQVAALKQ